MITVLANISKIRRNKRIAVGLIVVFVFLFAAVFAEFIAPYDHKEQSRSEPSAPRSTIRFVDADGKFYFRPFIYEKQLSEPLSLRYTEDTDKRFPIEFFTRGTKYRLLGLFETDLRLIGLQNGAGTTSKLRLLGTDSVGRDRFSRLVHALRFSMIVSPLGAFLACVFGIVVGTVSGYSPRTVDTVLMGASDAMLSLPTLIIILAARAAFPLELPIESAVVLLVGIFALTGWAEMARLTRSLVASTRELDYVVAARSIGLTQPRILARHILPNISRPLLTQATMILPVFLLSEAALSFLGVGLQEPEASLGNMLAAAGDVTSLKRLPLEMLSPAIVIFVFVLGIRLLSDGLNDERRAVKMTF